MQLSEYRIPHRIQTIQWTTIQFSIQNMLNSLQHGRSSLIFQHPNCSYIHPTIPTNSRFLYMSHYELPVPSSCLFTKTFQQSIPKLTSSTPQPSSQSRLHQLPKKWRSAVTIIISSYFTRAWAGWQCSQLPISLLLSLMKLIYHSRFWWRCLWSGWHDIHSILCPTRNISSLLPYPITNNIRPHMSMETSFLLATIFILSFSIPICCSPMSTSSLLSAEIIPYCHRTESIKLGNETLPTCFGTKPQQQALASTRSLTQQKTKWRYTVTGQLGQRHRTKMSGCCLSKLDGEMLPSCFEI